MRLPNTLGEWLAAAASGVTILVAVGALYLHMHTDLEAAEQKKAVETQLAVTEKTLQQEIIDLREENVQTQKSLQNSIDRSEVLRLRREVRRLEADKREPGISVIEQGQKQADIDYYNGVILCIQAKHENCL